MDESAVRDRIHELIAAYAETIDDDRLEEWPDFFVEDCRYLITSRQSHEAGYRHGVVYAASKGMLVDRILALRRANIFEPHRYRHIIGPIRLGRIADGVAEVRSNFIAVRIMHDGEMSLFAAGRYLDRIAVSAEPYRFIERLVILDSDKIDTLLVIPL
ncbi:MAG TPA: aromatic-ring-hydroxylating dioxygenase subunit beta [Stellaceae bacterium]